MDITCLLEREQKNDEAIAAFVDDVVTQIASKAMDGVVIASASSPHIAIATLQTMLVSKEHIMQAEYYIPAAQAKAVKDVLMRKTRISDIQKAVQEMVDEGSIRCSSTVSYSNCTWTVKLNPVTIAILKGTGLYSVSD